MPSLNEVRLIGNLGGDPELKTVAGDKTVATFRIATNERFRDTERTEWHDVEVWAAQATTVGQYLTKGRLVMVLGSLRTDRWDDKNGGGKRSRTKVVGHRVIFLDSPEKAELAGDPAGEAV
jgi:single-strand DNA-binding protein